ncbi:MAG: helix-turn-helix domain-containing protein [Acidimicrobiales bacterium]|nr:helix-turn-helix domain-containing protein [Acidimicrobiales bacterium]MCB9395921.1 helix-turn-helix domain-containing protein [Acidimicrobiaceae bacterium]
MSVFVGRERELARARAALRRADGTHGGLVWITGPGGIGKSALARRLAEVLDPTDICHGVADPIGLRPFGVLADALGAEAIPVVQAPLGAAVQVAGSAQVGDAVLAALAERSSMASAGGRPLVVVLDDVHRADHQTIDVIELVAAAVREQSVVVIATARVPEPGSRIDLALRGPYHALHLELGGMSDADVERLLVGAGVDATDARIAAGIDAAAGNPMLALAVAASGGSVAGEVLGLRSFVRRAMADLGEPDADVARAVALLADTTDLGEVAAVADLSQREAARAVDRAAIAGLCIVDGPSIRPRHDLVSAEIESTIAPTLATLMHRRAADHLRRVDGAPYRLVAHALAAGVPDPGWVVEVIERVVAAEPSSALAMIDLVRPRVGDPVLGRRLDVVRARSLAAVGRATAATEVATALLEVVPEPAVRAVLHRELALVAIVESRPLDAATQMTAALALLDDDVARARARSELAVAFLVQRDIVSAGQHASEALPAAEAVRDPVALTAALEVELFTAACRGEVERVHEIRRRLGAMLTLAGVEPAFVYQPWLVAAVVDLDLGRSTIAASMAVDGRAAAERTGARWAVATYDVISATAAAYDGAFADAAAIAHAAIDGAALSDPFGIRPWAFGVLALAALHTGDHALAAHAVELGAEAIAAVGPTLGSEQWAIAAARLRLLDGDPVEARRSLDDWWDLYEALPSRFGQLRLTGELAALAAAAGDAARVEDVAAVSAPYRTSAEPLFAAHANEAAFWARPDATALLRAADAWSLVPKGLALGGLGRLAAAQVEPRADRLVRQRLDVLRRQLGLDEPSLATTAPRTGGRGLPTLTRSELEVARLVAEGFSNREIADRLVVSRRTVESHMGAIYRKLAVSTRVQVANVVAASDG